MTECASDRAATSTNARENDELTVIEHYKFVQLQMAAEAFLVNDKLAPLVGADYTTALHLGNFHSSKFTEVEAVKFAGIWEVVSQRSTDSGFSGTVFRCIQSDPATGRQ